MCLFKTKSKGREESKVGGKGRPAKVQHMMPQKNSFSFIIGKNKDYEIERVGEGGKRSGRRRRERLIILLLLPSCTN